MVLIHGAGDGAAVWERQREYFSKAHRVLAIDLPGHGALLEILTPSSHYPMVEQEEGFNRSLEAFLSAAAPASAGD